MVTTTTTTDDVDVDVAGGVPVERAKLGAGTALVDLQKTLGFSEQVAKLKKRRKSHSECISKQNALVEEYLVGDSIDFRVVG